MNCENAHRLVPSYLDGELTEEQSAPLREHLFACPACREVAKDGRALKRWFADPGEVHAPDGFAARVARRAFAGDPGYVLEPVGAAGSGTARGAQGDASGGTETPLLPFVLKLTAVAALVLFAFSIGIQDKSLPQGDGLEAQEAPWERAHVRGLDRSSAAAAQEAPPAMDEDEPEEDDGSQ